jgi:hypothetical protein
VCTSSSAYEEVNLRLLFFVSHAAFLWTGDLNLPRNFMGREEVYMKESHSS